MHWSVTVGNCWWGESTLAVGNWHWHYCSEKL